MIEETQEISEGKIEPSQSNQNMVKFSELPTTKSLTVQKIEQPREHFLTECSSLAQNSLFYVSKKLVGAYCEEYLKLYEIKDRKIFFHSDHRIILPADIDTRTLEYFYPAPKHEMFLFAKKKKIPKGREEQGEDQRQQHEGGQREQEEALEGQEEGQRDERGGQNNEDETLVYLVKFAHTKDYNLPAEFWGSIKPGYQGYEDHKIEFDLEVWHGFKSMERMYIITATKQQPNTIKTRSYFIAQLSKNHKNVLKPVFDFNFKFRKNPFYQENLKPKPTSSLQNAAEIANELIFSCNKNLQFQDSPSMPDRRFSSFYKVETQILVAGTFDLRNKKLLSKHFLTALEIFEKMGFSLIYHCNEIRVHHAQYSANQDTLFIIFSVLPEYLNPENPEHAQIYRNEMVKAISENRPQRVLFDYQGEDIKPAVYQMRISNFSVSGKRGFEWKVMGVRDSMINPFGADKVQIHDEDKEYCWIDIFGSKGRSQNLLNYRTIEAYDELDGSREIRKGLKKTKIASKNGEDENRGNGSGSDHRQIKFSKTILGPGNDKLSSIFSAVNIDESTLVVEDHRFFLLMDQKTGEVLDHVKYTQSLTPHESRLRADKDIIVNLVRDCGLVYIYRIIEEEEELRGVEGRIDGGGGGKGRRKVVLRHIDTLDVEENPNLVDVKEVRSVRVTEDGVLQVIMIVRMKTNLNRADVSHSIVIAEKQINPPKNKKTEETAMKQEAPEAQPNDAQRDPKSPLDAPDTEDDSGWTFEFFNSLDLNGIGMFSSIYTIDNTTYILTNRGLDLAIEQISGDPKEKIYLLDYRYTPGNPRDIKFILESHYSKDTLYVQLEDLRQTGAHFGELVKLRVPNPANSTSPGERVVQMLKTIKIEPRTTVFFDHCSTPIRIYCLYEKRTRARRNRDQGPEELNREDPANDPGQQQDEDDDEGNDSEGEREEDVFDRGREVEELLNNQDQGPVNTILEIYDENLEKLIEIDFEGYLIDFVKYSYFASLNQNLVFMKVNRLEDGRFMSFILNIKEKSLTEILDPEGQNMDADMQVWTGDRLFVGEFLGFDSDFVAEFMNIYTVCGLVG